jgi:hypothetical protein
MVPAVSSPGIHCPRGAVSVAGTRYEPHSDIPSLRDTVGVENDDIVLAGEYIRNNMSYLALSTYI